MRWTTFSASLSAWKKRVSTGKKIVQKKQSKTSLVGWDNSKCVKLVANIKIMKSEIESENENESENESESENENE